MDFLLIQIMTEEWEGIHCGSPEETKMTPEDMEKAILRNLPEKTGKSLEQWFAVLSAVGRTETRALKDALKKDHGVGHFQAQTIVKHFLQQ